MERSEDDLPLRLARAMLWASFVILLYIRTMSGIWRGVEPLGLLLATLSYLPLIAIVGRRRRPAVQGGLLVALVLLHLLPFAVVGTQWDWMPWTVAAAVLCVLPARWAWPLFVLVVVAAGAGAALLGHGTYYSLWFMIVTADDGLIVFGLAALVGTVGRLHATRGELARLARLRERLRLDGELRDLLGGQLQATAFRLRKAAAAEPRDAREDLRESVVLARRTLAEVRATAAAYRAGSIAEPAVPIESSRPARAILLAVLLIQCVLVLSNLYYVEAAGMATMVPAVAGLVVIVVLQVMPQTRATLIAQGLLILLPLAVIPGSWDRVLSFLTGKVLLHGRPPRSWALAGVILAGHLALMLSEDGAETTNVLANLGGHIMLAWLVYSLGRLSDLVTVLQRARRELAEDAVRQERTRISQDLHDVLGFSLSAVALKGEVAGRLLDSDPGRARTEMASLLSLVERAAAELESITGDRVELHLATEAEAACQLLTSAGVDVSMRIEAGSLRADVDTALAATLRETVTNVLRHSRARTCDITVSATDELVRLRVVNDGTGAMPVARAGLPTAAQPGRRGSGLGSLARRSGGRLTAGHQPGDRFEVVAEFPLGTARPGDSVALIGPIGISGDVRREPRDAADLGGLPPWGRPWTW
ncbi:sensor histidine kinase [Nonomuraea rubra]|uniref:sensor histidine kinase n=1 Tax=Nonomuraea rubra TaxID=46180 RepID=UPI003404402B